MNWRGEVRTAFFQAWKQAGLPPPEPFERAYAKVLASHVQQAPSSPGKPDGDPLHQALVGDVYGFGAFIADLTGSLLDLPPHKADGASDWSGRFNLGVSLFDYLCDVADQADTIAALPPFNSLPGRERRANLVPDRPAGPSLFLQELAVGVLGDLGKLIGSQVERPKPDQLWQVLGKMLDAELSICNARLDGRMDPRQVEPLLRSKAVEPFRVMAEYTSLRGCSKAAPGSRHLAISLGRAIGRCYWFADDANDVWVDLRTGQWNLLLVRAVTIEPRIQLQVPSTVTVLQVEKALQAGAVLQREARRCARHLRRVVSHCPTAPSTQMHLLGLMAASLARWS
jgi:hypothetical protein